MDWQHYENNKSLKCLINMHLFYLLSLECYISHIPKHTQLSSRSGLDNMDPKRAFSNISTSITCVCQFYYIYIKKGKRKVQGVSQSQIAALPRHHRQIQHAQIEQMYVCTKISSLFPKRGNHIAKRTENTRTK